MAKNKKQSSVTIQAAKISAVGLFVTSIIVALFTYVIEKKPKGFLKVEDVTIIDTPDEIQNFWETWGDSSSIKNLAGGQQVTPHSLGSFSILDLKLSNPGKNPVILSKAIFEVSLLDKEFYDDNQIALPVSWVYSLLFDPNSQYNVYEHKVSQVINSNHYDRFLLIIGNKEDTGKLKYANYQCKISLSYSNGKTVKLGSYKIKIHSPLNNSKIKEIPELISF